MDIEYWNIFRGKNYSLYQCIWINGPISFEGKRFTTRYFISDTDNFCNTYKIEIHSDLDNGKTSYDNFCKVQNRKMYVTDLT